MISAVCEQYIIFSRDLTEKVFNFVNIFPIHDCYIPVG